MKASHYRVGLKSRHMRPGILHSPINGLSRCLRTLKNGELDLDYTIFMNEDRPPENLRPKKELHIVLEA